MKDLAARTRLSPEDLRRRYDPAGLPARSTAECPVADEIIGQPRALAAIELALTVPSAGYNVFLAGFEGTGRQSTVDCLLKRFVEAPEPPPDLCYVHRFGDPERPRLVVLPAGSGKRFRDEITECARYLGETIPSLLESDEFGKRVRETVSGFEETNKKMFREFEERLRLRGLALQEVQVGSLVQPRIVYAHGDQAVDLDDLDELARQGLLTPEHARALAEEGKARAGELQALLKSVRKAQKELRRTLRSARHELVRPALEGAIEDVLEDFLEPAIKEYLDEVREFVLENLDRFQAGEEADPARAPSDGRATPPDPTFPELQVNVLVDNSRTVGRPVVTEHHPSVANLCGSIDSILDPQGGWRTDFTQIRPGAVLRASGGFLLVNVLDLLQEPGAFSALKRVLLHRKVSIESSEAFPFLRRSTLRPDPIEVNVKVLLAGPHELYGTLYDLDPGFREVFKVKADFDWEMESSDENVARFLGVLSKICQENDLLSFDGSGMAATLEHAARLAGRRDRLSTRFGRIADLARESDFAARSAGATRIGAKHVERAVLSKIERSDLFESKIQEAIERGSVLVDLSGAKVGQVNGLAVYRTEDYSFGKPSRITARTSVGAKGVVNVEREARLSGRTHDKGVLILAGYLQERFGREKPISCTATLCFEQSYSGVDGDSASSTELYALLSSLSGVPLRQDLAVTGSVNQHGEVQAIGGANEKIEGFFDVCHAVGLTGEQGVLIPAANAGDLSLRLDVVRAVEKGKFHVHAIRHVDEGIELLTGRPALEIYAAAERTLSGFADRLRDYSRPPGEP
ncbi:MAG: AAA family ATPase [Planctomycetes bacterium]|nr:AAA family ATPase [Planctomycetota bacterium]